MKRSTMIMAAVGVLAVAGLGTAAVADDDFCKRGKHGMHGKHAMQGPHGQGYQMGGMGGDFLGGPSMKRFMKDGNFDLKLTPERVKDIIEGKLAWRGNENLKVGEVTTDADGQIIAQLVTKDNSLVETLKFDPKTGARSRVN